MIFHNTIIKTSFVSYKGIPNIDDDLMLNIDNDVIQYGLHVCAERDAKEALILLIICYISISYIGRH